MNVKPNADSQSSVPLKPAVPEIKTPDQDKTKAGTKPEKDGTLHTEINKTFGALNLISEYFIFSNITLIFIRFFQKDEKAVIVLKR